MGVICFICGAVFGGVFGVTAMCCVQVGAKSEGNKKDLSDTDKSFNPKY